jgi:hypothetical protein
LIQGAQLATVQDEFYRNNAVENPMYSPKEFLEDATLVGKLLYAYQGVSCIYSSRGCLPALDQKYWSAFVGELYSYIELTSRKRLYRFFGGAAVRDGGWWAAQYPYQEIHADLPSWYAPSSRENLAVKDTWSTMTDLVEADWPSGSRFFYGRAASQANRGKLLQGGHLQYFYQDVLPAGLKILPVATRM